MKLQPLKYLFILFTFIATISGFACPEQVLVIRHGEKPSKGIINLSPIGYFRANMLPNIFKSPSGFNKPTLVAAGIDRSNRPFETCEPTSLALIGQQPETPFFITDNQQMAQRVLNLNTNTVLICWEHHNIPLLVSALTNNKVQLGQWGSNTFDRIIVLNYTLVIDENSKKRCQFTGTWQDLPEGNITKSMQNQAKENIFLFMNQKAPKITFEELDELMQEQSHQTCCNK